MLSIERCRYVLGADCQLTDDELERLRDKLYALADIAITALLEQRVQTDTALMGSMATAARWTDKEGKPSSAVESRPKQRGQ